MKGVEKHGKTDSPSESGSSSNWINTSTSRCLGLTHRLGIDLIRQVGGTPSSGAVRSNTVCSPLIAEAIATSPQSSSSPNHSGGRVLSQICGSDRRFGPPPGTTQRDVRTCVGETDRNRIVPRRNLLRSHRPERRKTWRQSRRCSQIDCTQGTFSGHARDHQNPVDLARLATDFSMPYLIQDEPVLSK